VIPIPDRLRDVRPEEDTSGSIPVAEDRAEGSKEHRRNGQPGCDEAGSSRATSFVCVDEQTNPHGPLGCVESREGELDAAQLSIAEHRSQDADRLPEGRER
jgi:hypothetical protein